MDNRGERLVKYPSYQALKVMLSKLQGANFVSLKEKDGLYRVVFDNKGKLIEVLWSLQIHDIPTNNQSIISRDGDEVKSTKILTITGSPVYLVQKGRV